MEMWVIWNAITLMRRHYYGKAAPAEHCVTVRKKLDNINLWFGSPCNTPRRCKVLTVRTLDAPRRDRHHSIDKITRLIPLMTHAHAPTLCSMHQTVIFLQTCAAEVRGKGGHILRSRHNAPVWGSGHNLATYQELHISQHGFSNLAFD